MAPHTPPPLSMQEAYLIPYGAIAFVSDILALYMVSCLLFGRAPLYPARRIRHIRITKFLIGIWIMFLYVLNTDNIAKCWPYWDLVLINISNGVMSALGALVAYYGFGACEPVKDAVKENDPESPPAPDSEVVSLSTPDEEITVPDERVDDSARKYGTVTDMPSTGLSGPSSSNLKERSDSANDVNLQRREVARELNNMANEPAQVQAQIQDANKVKVVYLAVLGAYIGMTLIGSTSLARQAVLEGKTSSIKICLIFGIVGGLTVLGILFTVVYECYYFGKETELVPVYLRVLFVTILALLLTFFTDWILGCLLGSLSGVPIADIRMEELSRYWVYLLVTKLPMFAF